MSTPVPNLPSALRRFDAVICDIDGCIGPESSAPMDTRSLLALAEHNRTAIRWADRPVVTLCSGRPQPFVEAICRVIANDALPCICENGVWVYDPRDQRFLSDPSITADHRRMVREATMYIENEWLPKGVIIQPGKSASMSLWHPDTVFLRTVVPALEAKFAEQGWEFRVSMTVEWINCDLKHISKATGIDRVLEMTGLRSERLAGIGDSLSDLPMAHRVKLFACPNNAAPALKAHAGYISPKSEIEGVLEILDHLRIL